MFKITLALVLTFGCASVTLAQNFKQSYSTWQLRENSRGEKFFECIYTASDQAGRIVNRQQVWYFPNAPRVNELGGTDTDKCNYWVYWYNPNKQVMWGRCPTPKHPDYAELQRDTGGKDLWEVIPKEGRKAGVVNIATVAPRFGKAFSVERSGQPVVAEGQADTIQCVDFTNAIFN